MAEKDKTPVAVATPPVAPVPPALDADGMPTPPKRSPGHRGADVKDTVAEMAAKAHEISLEAGSKMAAAMKEVVSAAAGLTGFAIESARDLAKLKIFSPSERVLLRRLLLRQRPRLLPHRRHPRNRQPKSQLRSQRRQRKQQQKHPLQRKPPSPQLRKAPARKQRKSRPVGARGITR
jgi:hypothetical protein